MVLSRVLPVANGLKVWCLNGVIQENIFITFEKHDGQKMGSKVFHAAWSLNHKASCPDYDNYQINAIQELLLKA